MKNKYIFGGVIIVIFFAIMGYLLSESSIAYENDFSLVKNYDKKVRATGMWVKEKGYEIDKENRLFKFVMEDDHGVELKVEYKGTIPNNFETATSVVVTGTFEKGIFKANNILTKCPSKYEEQFDESKSS